MNNIKRFAALALALVLCLSLLCACGGGEATYKVSVVDALGNPITSGVVVKFMQNGTQAGMQVVNDQGVAEKALPKGDYTVELQFTSSDVEYKYDASALTLSASKTELEVVLSLGLGSNTQTLYVGNVEYEAYHITAGATQFDLNPEARTYFLFAPTEGGTYEFTLGGSDAAIGYYGAPHFVQDTSAAEVVDNKFTVSIRPDMIGTGNTGTTTLVIGVDAGTGTAVMGINRIGDHQWSVTDEPWTTYNATHTPESYTLPAGSKLGEFDLTSAGYELVKDGQGFYHLGTADGPLVLCRLGKAAKLPYLDPFETILEHTGVTKYFYDENGNFVKKENYGELVNQYIACVDAETGTYPLTEDLVYIIKAAGDHNGWWSTEENYIFKDSNGNNVIGINEEISWLFMCCYIEE